MKMFGGTIKLNPVGLVLMAATALLLYYMMMVRSPGGEGNKIAAKSAVSLRSLLAVCLELTEIGGEQVKLVSEGQRLRESVKGKTKEGAEELVTDADLRSHRIIVHGLQKAYPNIKIISEEHDANPVELTSVPIPNGGQHLQSLELTEQDELVQTREITVWVDPLDATQEFTENLKEYVTVMICIAVKGKATIGIIHQPFSKHTDWGWIGHESSKSRNLLPTDASKSNSRRIIISRSHAGEVATLIQQAFGNDTKIQPAGGAGYKTLQVVMGIFDAYLHKTSIKKWDVCAGDALLKSVGGRMTTLDGKDLDYSANGSEVNEGGILGTLFNHEEYLQLLRNIVNESTAI